MKGVAGGNAATFFLSVDHLKSILKSALFQGQNADLRRRKVGIEQKWTHTDKKYTGYFLELPDDMTG